MAIEVVYEPDTFGQSEWQVARIHYDSTLSFDTLLQEASGGSARDTLALQEASGRITSLVTRLLAEGERVKTPLGTFSLGLRPFSRARPHKGTRNTVGMNEPDRFGVTPGRLKIVFRADAGVMKQLRALARLQRVDSAGRRMPVVHSIRSLEQDRDAGRPLTFVPGELITITGYALDLDQHDAQQGLFLVTSDPGAPEIRAAVYARTGPRIVVAKCPVAPAGNYSVSVRTRPTAASIREGNGSETVEIARE